MYLEEEEKTIKTTYEQLFRTNTPVPSDGLSTFIFAQLVIYTSTDSLVSALPHAHSYFLSLPLVCIFFILVEEEKTKEKNLSHFPRTCVSDIIGGGEKMVNCCEGNNRILK